MLKKALVTGSSVYATYVTTVAVPVTPSAQLSGRGRVGLQRRALLAGVLARELVAALAEAEEEGEQRRAGQHVPGHVHVGRDAARDAREARSRTR